MLSGPFPQCPAGHRHPPLVCPGRKDEPSWAQDPPDVGADRKQVVRLEGTPYPNALEDLDPGLLRPRHQSTTVPVLGVQALLVHAEVLRGLLVELASQLRPLIDEQDVEPALGRDRRRCQSRRAAAKHQQVWRHLTLGQRRARGRLQQASGRLPLHRLAVACRRHASQRSGLTVHDEGAFVAHAHAAEDPADVAGSRHPAGTFPAVDERRRQGVSSLGVDHPTFVGHPNGPALVGDAAAGNPHVRWRWPSPAPRSGSKHA